MLENLIPQYAHYTRKHVTTAFILGSVLSFGLGMYFAVEKHMNQPQRVEVVDINHDGKSDLVVHGKWNYKKFIFLAQEDGSYKSTNQLKEESMELLEKKYDSME